MEEGEAPEDEGSRTLVSLCVRAVSRNMERLEPEVWKLPAMILQDILPFLNIYYLDRIEPAAVKKGLSTESIWCKLCQEIARPARFETITNWKKKFLEVFFHRVLRGILDVSKDTRLMDQRFSPLIHSSRHVTDLVIFHKLEGVLELTPPVVESLVHSVRTLKFLHLRSPDSIRQQSLQSLLHRLIHHGELNKVAFLSWPAPDTNLLVVILSIIAGYWHKQLTNSCRFCNEDIRSENTLLLDKRTPLESLVPCVGSVKDSTGDDLTDQWNIECEMGQDETPSALLTLQPLDLNQSHWEDASKTRHKSPSVVTLNSKPQRTRGSISKNAPRQDAGLKIPPVASDQCKRPSPTSQKRLHADLDKTNPSDNPTAAASGATSTNVEADLYDFIFTVANEKKTKTSPGNKSLGERGFVHPSSSAGLHGALGARFRELPFFDTAPRFRSISALNIHNVPLALENCQILCHLLSTWVTLEKLTMAYNDLGSNIFPVLEALVALSRQHTCSLSAVSLSEFTVHIPTLDVAHTLLTAFPSLRVLALSFDVENIPEKPRLERSFAEFPENQLEQLDIRFPREPLPTGDLLNLLSGSKNLCEFSLDNATFTSSEELRHVLQTLSEFNTTLRRLSFHDMFLADCQDEILLLLRKSYLEDVKLSFCHLLEKRPDEFLSEMVNTLKMNSTLKTLKLCGNRLGNNGLVLLADIFAEDSSSIVNCLDVSSNCIKSDGLLQFAKKLQDVLQRGTRLRLTFLSLCQNLLDRDPKGGLEALHLLRGMCNVITDKWDSAPMLVFGDHVSVM